MRESLVKTVDGREYQFTQLGAKSSLKILLRISKIIGKPLALAVTASGGDGTGKSILDNDLKPELLALAVEALTDRLDQDEVLGIIESLVGGDAALCDGKRISFDMHYQGDLGHLFKVVQAALEAQYGNFLGALLTLRGGAKELKTPAST